MNRHTRTAISRMMGYGPAAIWLIFSVWRFGPPRGSWPVLGLALVVGVGILGLTGVFLAWFPWAMERLGLERFATWLRGWWDEDAR